MDIKMNSSPLPEKRKIRFPPSIREQYFSIFSKPEPEMIHPELYKQIIDYGTDIILEQIKKFNDERRKFIKDLEEKIEIKEAKFDEDLAKNILIVSSDAGNNGVDLRSAFAPLYAAVAIAVKGWEIIDEPITRAGKPELWAGFYKPRERESMLAMKTQFEVTLEAVEKWNPNMVVFDGPLVLHYGLMPPKGEAPNEYWRDFKETTLSCVRLLGTCLERGIPIVGFVKRTRMSKLIEIFGRKNATFKIRDTAILDLILRRGQYTFLEGELKGGVVNQYREACEKLGFSKDESLKITSFHSAYIRTGLTTPYRLELPEYCLNKLEVIASVLYTTSEEDGIPFAICEVDKLSKITNTISNIRSLMLFSKALDLVKNGELSPEDLNLLALQHGEVWSLREERYFQDLQQLQGGT